jgi:alkaline phosphatase D
VLLIRRRRITMKRTLSLLLIAVGIAAAPHVAEYLLAQGMTSTRSLALARPTHGVASGDITATSAMIWARGSRSSVMRVEYSTDPDFRRARRARPIRVTEETDFTGKIKLERLEPATLHHYRVWFSRSDNDDLESRVEDAVVGQFKTAPNPDDDAPVSFLLGGDTGGQRYCRRGGIGYRIYSAMRDVGADFYIQNGDGVYADLACPEQGPEKDWINIPGDFLATVDPSFDWTDQPLVRDTILAHYHYNWEDQHVQKFLGSMSTYAQWDDHEVIDDFGAQWEFLNPLDMRPGFPVLVEEGLNAFLNYWPIEPNRDEPKRIYRSFRWGKNVELFLLDARSYRSRNNLADTPENDKTLLGKAQLAWLKEALAHSTATWKVVSSDCPLAIWRSGGSYPIIGQDCWAHGSAPDFSSQTGFTRELVDLMTFLDDHNVKNMVWLATDVHAVYSTRFEFDGNADGRPTVFHEFVVGPLSAVRAAVLRPMDDTLNPRLLFGMPGIFNFGHFRVEPREDGSSHFIAEARYENGDVVPGSVIDLVAER